jgi:drug/metabolite transporter (DMT)-like permease
MEAGRTPWRAVLLALLAASLFGTLGVLSRTAYAAGLAPFALVAWRAGIGGLGLWVPIAWRRGPRGGYGALRAAGPSAGRALVVAIVAAATLNLTFFLAFQRTAIALALLGFYTYPAMVAGAAAALGREPLDRTRVAALALALGGMVAVVAGGLDPSVGLAVDPLGITLALVAAMCQTVFVLVSPAYGGVRADEAMGGILAGSAVIAAFVCLAAEGPAALVLPFTDPTLLALLLGVGLFAAAIPSLLFLVSLRRLGPVRAGIVMLFEPVVGVTLAALLLDERATPLQILGGATILVAAGLVQRRSGGAPETEAAPAVAPAPGGP